MRTASTSCHCSEMQEGITVSLANLQLIGTRLNRCMDSVDVQLDELAREVTREKENPEDLLVTLSELKGAGIPSVAWVSFLQKVSRRLQQNGGLHICLPPSLLPEAPMQGAAGRIAYVQNPLSETAYGRLLSFLPEAAGNAFDHFQDICEEVYNGICEYCLLPVSNSSEGRLSRFCGMILKYDLKICAACDVSAPDGNGSTRFALLRKTIRALPPSLSGISDDLHFCLVLPTDTLPTLSELLHAADLCKLQVLYVDTQPDFIGDDLLHLCRMRVRGGDLATFFLYLRTDAPHFTPIGLYPLL